MFEKTSEAFVSDSWIKDCCYFSLKRKNKIPKYRKYFFKRRTNHIILSSPIKLPSRLIGGKITGLPARFSRPPPAEPPTTVAECTGLDFLVNKGLGVRCFSCVISSSTSLLLFEGWLPFWLCETASITPFADEARPSCLDVRLVADSFKSKWKKLYETISKRIDRLFWF